MVKWVRGRVAADFVAKIVGLVVVIDHREHQRGDLDRPLNMRGCGTLQPYNE
jgi:hypothetical protein